MNRIKFFTTFLILGMGILLYSSHPAQAQGFFIRGDINCDGVVDTVDLRLLFPIDGTCTARHDVDDNGDISAADLVYLQNYLFFSGPPPPHPFPNCGLDTTFPILSCLVSCCCTLTTQCNDRIDNDQDGLTDYPEDCGCVDACDSIESFPDQCKDGIDNDGDGFTDYVEDCGCSGPCDSTEAPNPATQCSDGIDNDGDGFIDLVDCGCSDTCDLSEGPRDQCRDGIDNDRDGLVDLADTNCVDSCDVNEFTFCSDKPCDANGSGSWSLSDVIALVNIVYKGAVKPSPLCRADCNGTGGNPNLTDIIYLVNKVFKGGPNPLPVGECCLP